VDEARNQLAHLKRLIENTNGFASRPDSEYLIEPVIYGTSSPELLQTLIEEIEQLQKKKGTLGFQRDYSQAYLGEVSAYLKAWYLITTSTPEKIMERWKEHWGAGKVFENKTKRSEKGLERYEGVTEEDIAHLYAISYLCLKEIEGEIKDTFRECLRWSGGATSYFEWLLTHTLGEIGDEETADFLLGVSDDIERSNYVRTEFDRELAAALHRISHRAGKRLCGAEPYFHGIRSNVHIQLGEQSGSKIQMSDLVSANIDSNLLLKPCVCKSYRGRLEGDIPHPPPLP
jgi:hypothetical protein